MSVMTVTMEPVAAATPGTGPKKRALRGLRLRQAEKALKSLRTIMRQDEREARRAEARGYTPYMCLGKKGSASVEACKKLIERLNTAISAKI